MITPGLSARSRHILKSLVDLYIASGEPVGSKTLSQLPDLAYSPATIRNVMAELENAGLIHSPHTSAGRIPTRQGYRLFVDSLLTVRPLEQAVLEQVRTLTHHQTNPQAMMQAASQVLSGLTKMAGVVTTPRKNRTTLRQIEFLKLSRQRVLVILVLNQAEVQNRIIITPKEFSQSELTEAGNYLTHHFSGHELTSIHQSLVDKMQADKDTIDQRMAMVINAAHNSLQVADDRDYMVAGHSNLVGMVDQDVNRLKELFDIFAQKQQVLQLLDQSLSADGVQIYIGEESGFEALGACSIVRAPYHVDQQTVGMIGVIGPTRMAYDKVIPLVDMTAKIVSMALQEAQ